MEYPSGITNYNSNGKQTNKIKPNVLVPAYRVQSELVKVNGPF